MSHRALIYLRTLNLKIFFFNVFFLKYYEISSRVREGEKVKERDYIILFSVILINKLKNLFPGPYLVFICTLLSSHIIRKYCFIFEVYF